MATAFTRFELQIPQDTDPNHQAAVTTFLDNLGTLCKFTYSGQYLYTNLETQGEQVAIVYGLITTAQQATALGYLNTLNAALGANVTCIVWPVTSEP